MRQIDQKYIKLSENQFKIEDLKELQTIILEHSDLYYNKQNPIISDKEYDILFKKLQNLEVKFKIKDKLSLKIWATLKESTFEKVKHSRPMISLDNTYNEDDLNNFDTRIFKLSNNRKNIYTLEFKFDWLWIELIYTNWKLIRAITRGDWIEWEDVTQNILMIDNIPKTIKYKWDLEVRWEIVMPISIFNELNKKAKIEWTKIFSNPRNAASWSVRMKNNFITKQRKLKFFAYDLANFEEYRSKQSIIKYNKVIDSLHNIWFDISSYFLILDWIDEVINAIKSFWNITQTIDFEIDGLVIKLNDIEKWVQIWSTDHHPRYAISYKFPAEIFTTKILSVDFQVWKTWTITPVANLEEVNIDWVIIKRATLHNFEEIKNLDVKIGDKVFIKRAGEVIPKIISVIKDWDRNNLETIKIPQFCPSCKTIIQKDDNKVRYYCPNNIDCIAKHHEKLSYAVWKQGFNIAWLWPRQIDIFLSNWIINNLSSIFKLSEKIDEILLLEWFQEKSVQKLVENIKKSKTIKISTLLTSLWIMWVWKKSAKNISILFKTKNNLINFNNTLEDIENINDIWPELAKNIIEYFNNDKHKEILKELVEILNIEYYIDRDILDTNYFSGKKVCITGSFINEGIKIPRNDLVLLLEEVGWEFMSSVTSKTDFLLAWGNVWSKLKKAKELWIKTIDLLYFFKKIK